MRTLYLRNVPDEVVARLERLATREGLSLSRAAIRELTEVTRRADNAALLGTLPDFEVDSSVILEDLEAERLAR
ncbi:MAG: antitoxin [Actinomycetota bacterium]|nr:antitoxin [Actinomycetota bacterium]